MVDRWPLAVLGVVLAASLAARLRWLGDEVDVNEPDETMYVIMAENFARGSLYPRYDYERGNYRGGLFVVPPMPLYTAGLVFRVFGVSLRNFRAMNVAFGLACIAAFHALSGLYLRGLPRAVALAVFALSPVALYESTLALLGAPALFFLIVSLWSYVLYVRERRRGDLGVFALSLGAAAACKQYGLLLGGVVAVHWLCVAVRGRGPRVRGLFAALGLAAATFVVLVPWVVWRPYDSLHVYLWRSVLLHVVMLLRGARGGGSFLSLPYPELVFALGVVGLLGLAAFLLTWRKRGDVLAFYGVLLALPIILVREVRYLGLALPALCLFVGYLVGAIGETAGRRWRVARAANAVLVAMLLAAAVLPAAVPWRARSGLPEACRYVASHTEPGDLVMANYWRPVVERLTRRRMPDDWLGPAARRRIEQGAVRYVILDNSQYTRRLLHKPERRLVAEWVRRTYRLEKHFGRQADGTEVYGTDGGRTD